MPRSPPPCADRPPLAPPWRQAPASRRAPRWSSACRAWAPAARGGYKSNSKERAPASRGQLHPNPFRGAGRRPLRRLRGGAAAQLSRCLGPAQSSPAGPGGLAARRLDGIGQLAAPARWFRAALGGALGRRAGGLPARCGRPWQPRPRDQPPPSPRVCCCRP
jgi:hypothetical protein